MTFTVLGSILTKLSVDTVTSSSTAAVEVSGLGGSFGDLMVASGVVGCLGHLDSYVGLGLKICTT